MKVLPSAWDGSNLKLQNNWKSVQTGCSDVSARLGVFLVSTHCTLQAFFAHKWCEREAYVLV